jgi:hypothetical protein
LGTGRSLFFGLPGPTGIWSSAKPSSSLNGATLSDGGPRGLAEEPLCTGRALGVPVLLDIGPRSDSITSDIITEAILGIYGMVSVLGLSC